MNFPRNSQLRHQLIHQEGVQEGKRQQFSSIHASVLAEHSIAIGRLEGSLVGRTDCFLPEALDFGKIVPVLQLVVFLLEKPVESLALLVLQMAHKLFGHFVLQKVLEQSAPLCSKRFLNGLFSLGFKRWLNSLFVLRSKRFLNSLSLLCSKRCLVFCCHNLSFTKNLRPSSSPLFVTIV